MTRYLRDRTKEMDRIKIREKETSSELEGKILYLQEARSKLETRESEMMKIRSDLDDAVMSPRPRGHEIS